MGLLKGQIARLPKFVLFGSFHLWVAGKEVNFEKVRNAISYFDKFT